MPEKNETKLIQKRILRDPLMWKFRFYGFIKNLRFFEPYLLIILLVYFSDSDFPLLKIGSLVLVQEVFTYVFEVPSGIIADKFGKKNELLICFIFYIVSFGLYFTGLRLSSRFVFVLFFAAGFFGLGEAFRSGTHKAMILTWMDKNEFQEFKSFVYGTTRSWSLIGSAINGVLSIFLIFAVGAIEWIFIIAIVPYVLDFILITTYPSYMNDHVTSDKTILQEMRQGLKDIFSAFKNRNLVKGVFSSASYDAVYKSIKDYIQPVIKIYIGVIILNLGLDSLGLTENNLITIILGSMYTIFYIFSSVASRNAYRVKTLVKSSKRAMDILFYLFAGVLILNSVFIWVNIPVVVIFLFLFIYIFENLRRPLAVDFIGGIMKKEQRATILSVEAQFKSILVFIFAPLFGFIADFSIPVLFVIIAGVIVLVNTFLLFGEDSVKKQESTSKST